MVRVLITGPVYLEDLLRSFKLELANYFGLDNVRLFIRDNYKKVRVYVNGNIVVDAPANIGIRALRARFWSMWRRHKDIMKQWRFY